MLRIGELEKRISEARELRNRERLEDGISNY